MIKNIETNPFISFSHPSSNFILYFLMISITDQLNPHWILPSPNHHLQNYHHHHCHLHFHHHHCLPNLPFPMLPLMPPPLLQPLHAKATTVTASLIPLPQPSMQLHPCCSYCPPIRPNTSFRKGLKVYHSSSSITSFLQSTLSSTLRPIFE